VTFGGFELGSLSDNEAGDNVDEFDSSSLRKKIWDLKWWSSLALAVLRPPLKMANLRVSLLLLLPLGSLDRMELIFD
jgi:hypothetical protein